MQTLQGLGLVIEMAHEYSLETRIRCLIDAHRAAGDEPRTLVMNGATMHSFLEELDGRHFSQGYFWIPSADSVTDGDTVTVEGTSASISFFKGIPILIKDFVADMEVLVGV